MESTSNPIAEEVVVHAPVPQLDMLRVGCAPEIFSARRAPRRPLTTSTVASSGFEPETSRRRNPRFSTRSDRDILDETPPGEIPRTPNIAINFERTNKKKKMQQSKLVSEFRQTADFTESMTEKLKAYDNAKRLKTLVHNQDYEDHYIVPLQRRIKEKMATENYHNYLQRKAEMIRNIDRDPVPIHAIPRKLAPIPHMSVSVKGLKDPNLKYIEHQNAEKELERFISKANGEKIKEKKMPPPDTLNYKKLDLQCQTRFFFGKDPQANKKGRKAFECWDTSRVGNELDFF
ncbi:hypothetical protein TRFO_30632 [Tritrichomonas foetus]|uniref:Uncharacterized protein n=1 Tax=Tritrichomonas foetus TaxID=1144522 RepID=A0A1J4JYB9_9EUKA|nr:hypothetical protein TRFO_30632 [Tritrichomonas foetus]|eukprot:OHT02269.1 hypothetical protein TRFO_30632 [Tritrichomonas foetus]